ncbi:hypoxia induced protein conserved region-domain-containing protein [Umbelopsis sp. PMI_123]|nr:hypoxia induced protein conserved region-domain-containing protein [Umbelopsis sp. PMI_123]
MPSKYDEGLDDMERMRLALDHETGAQRMKRKFREEPFVPAGVALTCFALVAATLGIKQGRRQYANNMMRLRVAAQGFTVGAMVIGSIIYSRQQQEEKFAREREARKARNL